MKLRAFIAFVCLFTGSAMAQGVRYDNRVTTVAANGPASANAPMFAVPGVLVTICADGQCINNASIFSDSGLSVQTKNPIKTDGQGRFGFWIAPGSYFYKQQDVFGNVVGIFPFTLGGSGGSGGGLGPGGAVNEGQANPGSGPTTFLGNNLFSNTAKTILTTQSAFTAKQTNSVFNTDLNGGLSVTATCSGCAWNVPAGSAEANNPFTFLNGANANQYSGHDGRSGYNFYQNWIGNTQFPWSYGNQCAYGSTGINGTSGGSALGGCGFDNVSKVGGGVSGDNTWTNFAHHGVNAFFMTRGQSYLHADNLYFGKTGDSIVREANVNFRGGASGGADESDKFTSEHLTGLGDTWGTIATAGANNTSTGIASIKVALTGGSGFLMDGGYLAFENELMDTTTITGTSFPLGASGPQLLTTSTTHAVSTWQATLLADCGVYSHRDVKTPTPCPVNVTVNTTPPVANGIVSIVDAGQYEQAMISGTPPTGTGNQTITLWLSEHHVAGSLLMIGGTAGGVATFAHGLANPTTNPAQFFGWPIGGSPDATHEYVMVNYKQGQQGTQPILLPQLSTQAMPATTCAAGVVTVAAGGISPAQNFNVVLQGTEALVVSGSTANNGTITGIQVNADGSATWHAPGGACGGASSTGGTLAITNSQGFVEYCGAEVSAIADGAWVQLADGPHFVPSGALHLDPNHCAMALNATFVQPNRVEGEAQMYGTQFFVPDATVGSNLYSTILEGGPGMSGHPLIQHDTTNNVDPNVGDYFGHGGTNIGEVAWQENTPVLGMHSLLYSPFQYYAHVGCPLGGCLSTSIEYPIFLNDGLALQGNFGWNPSLSRYEMGPEMTFGALKTGHLTSWVGGGAFGMLNFSGDDTAGNEVGLIGAAGTGLFHLMPAGAMETWRWGGSGSNTGSLTATNFDYPGFSVAGSPVCTIANPCGGGTFTPPTGTGLAHVTAGVLDTASFPLAGAGAGVTTGPTSATTTNDIVGFTGTTGQIGDTGQSVANLILKNPGGSVQQVMQASNQQFTINYFNRYIWVDGFPSGGCTISGTVYTTQADCAFYSAAGIATFTGNSVTLVFGANNAYTKCAEWIEPTGGFTGVSIRGAGVASTWIQQTCSTPTLPMLTKTGSGSPTYLDIEDITFNAGNDAGSCFDLLGEMTGSGSIHNVRCLNVLPTATSGLDHYVQVGSTASFAEDWHIDGLFISPPFSNPTYATLSSALTGTALTGITITAGGNYAASGPTFGVGIVNDPHHFCSTLPAFTPVFTGTAMTGATITTAGSCTAAPDVSVILQTPVTYGAKLFLSDGTAKNVNVNAGITGIFAEGGNTEYDHIHCVGLQNCLLDEAGGHFTATELDTIADTGIEIVNSAFTQGVSFVGTSAVTDVGGEHLPGGIVFQFDSSTNNARISAMNQLCNTANSADYQEFVLSGTGPVTPGGTNWPAGVSVVGNDTSCTGFGTAGTTVDYIPTLKTGSGGTGVTTVSVATANGVSGTVANPTTTPAITLTLGSITPTSVAATGPISSTGAITAGASGGVGGTVTLPEGTAATAVAANEVCYADSTTHAIKCANNGGSFFSVTQTIASGSSALSVAAVGVGSCVTTTVAATGVLATDHFEWNPNGSLKAVTGYIPSVNGSLSIAAYPTAGNMNFDVCNWTAASITPGAVTINWGVTR